MCLEDWFCQPKPDRLQQKWRLNPGGDRQCGHPVELHTLLWASWILQPVSRENEDETKTKKAMSQYGIFCFQACMTTIPPAVLSNMAALSFLRWLSNDPGAQNNMLHNRLVLCRQISPNTVGHNQRYLTLFSSVIVKGIPNTNHKFDASAESVMYLI